MNFKMDDMRDMNQDHLSKLKAAGIESTDDMMRIWNDAALRASIVATTGIRDEQLVRLISIARMARMKGIGPKYAQLLVSAGVIGRRSLSTHTPETLLKRLVEVNGARKLASCVPTATEVETWFTQLKPAPE
jgi:Domain of unknown function (DUF4332)